METSTQLQLALFQKIRDILPRSMSLVNEVADTLNITNDSAYRRMRGEKALSVVELYLLATRFNVSVDEIFSMQNKGDAFLCKIIEARNISFEQYLKVLYENLLIIQSLRNPEIIYFAKDIPIFHHFHFPLLAEFKIFFWSKTVMQLPDVLDRKFEPGVVDDPTMEMGKKVLSLYSRIPAVEIWNEETINSCLRQLEYYLDSGIITKKEIALELCDDIKAMLNHISRQAETGAKFLPGAPPLIPGNFRLYNNEVILGDNSICVTSDHMKMAFITLNVLNLMFSTERVFCDKVEDYLRTMMKKASLISRDNEKERTRFFNLMHRKVEATRDRIRHS